MTGTLSHTFFSRWHIFCYACVLLLLGPKQGSLVSATTEATEAAATTTTEKPPPPDAAEVVNVVVSSELMDACARGDVAKVAGILDENPTWVHHGRSEDGETCLHVAGIYGRAGVTRLLLELGADPNVRTTFSQGLRMHPLSWNVFAGHVETARVLLHYGADPNLDFDATVVTEGGGGGGTNNNLLQPCTVMDVVMRFLDHPEAKDESPQTGRFRSMKQLLETYDAKTYQQLVTAQEL